MTSTLTCPQLSGAGVSTPENIVRRIFCELNNSDIASATNHFSDRFTFEDHALALTFTNREDLDDFFHKAARVLQDSSFEVESTTVCGDQVIAEWTLAGIKKHDPGAGLHRRTRVSVKGVSIARISSGTVTSWADYYDANRSWRFSLSGLYADY